MQVTRYGPGEQPAPTPGRALATPGDFILTHRRALPSRVIAFGQTLRFRGARRPFAHYTHAAFIAGADGTLLEALGAGITRTSLERYRDVEYHLVQPDASPAERLNMVRYAEAMWRRHTRYGWVEILSLGLQLLTGARLALTTDGHMICSGFVATALERTDAVFDRNAGCMMPADLAAHYNVRPLR
jgi:hypothetical protein